jgi:hypothetical protein
LEDSICNWAVIGKANQKPTFQTIFSPYKGDDEHLIEVKQYDEDALMNITVLTKAQRMVDWFTLRSFHLSATMFDILFNNTYDSKTNEEIICQLCKSWFSHSRSTAAMVIGAKNEGAIVNAFSRLNYVKGVFECGLLESKLHPLMAASPSDGVAVVTFNGRELILTSVEIKTRVAIE